MENPDKKSFEAAGEAEPRIEIKAESAKAEKLEEEAVLRLAAEFRRLEAEFEREVLAVRDEIRAKIESGKITVEEGEKVLKSTQEELEKIVAGDAVPENESGVEAVSRKRLQEIGVAMGATLEKLLAIPGATMKYISELTGFEGKDLSALPADGAKKFLEGAIIAGLYGGVGAYKTVKHFGPELKDLFGFVSGFFTAAPKALFGGIKSLPKTGPKVLKNAAKVYAGDIAAFGKGVFRSLKGLLVYQGP